jgi:hypothetical protein
MIDTYFMTTLLKEAKTVAHLFIIQVHELEAELTKDVSEK